MELFYTVDTVPGSEGILFQYLCVFLFCDIGTKTGHTIGVFVVFNGKVICQAVRDQFYNGAILIDIPCLSLRAETVGVFHLGRAGKVIPPLKETIRSFTLAGDTEACSAG